jgi:hypothetical protein
VWYPSAPSHWLLAVERWDPNVCVSLSQREQAGCSCSKISIYSPFLTSVLIFLTDEVGWNVEDLRSRRGSSSTTSSGPACPAPQTKSSEVACGSGSSCQGYVLCFLVLSYSYDTTRFVVLTLRVHWFSLGGSDASLCLPRMKRQ